MKRSLLLASCLVVAACQRPEAPPPEAGTAPTPPPSSAVEEGTTPSSDGVPIHYRVEGNGDPALVFVHCWSCDAGLWRNQVSYFAPRYRVVTLDLAGHGSSGRDRKSWTIDAFAADVVAVVEKLGLTRVVLVGHSMSGPITVEAARQMPDRVVALFPVDTLQSSAKAPDPKRTAEFLAPLRKDFRTAAADRIRGLFPKTADPGLVERVSSEIASAPPEIAIPTLEGIFSHDLRPALAEVKVPIHCLNSDRFPTPVEEIRKIHPRFEVTILPGVGHFPMLEAPDLFNAKLEEGLRQLAVASPATN